MAISNKLLVNFNHAKINEAFDFYQIVTIDKYINSGSYVIDKPIEQLRAESVTFDGGRSLFVMFKKGMITRYELADAIEDDKLSLKQVTSNELKDYSHAFQVPLAVVFAAHEGQHAGTAALHGQMDVPADVGMGGHGVDDFVADVLGMGGGKAHAQVRCNGGHHLQEPGEVHRLVGRFPQVAVHVLAQQGYFLISFMVHVAGFTHDGMCVPGTLGPAGIGHHAVGAYVVASSHDGNKGRYAASVRANGGDVGISLFPGQQYVNLRGVRADGLQQAGPGTVGIGAHHQVHLAGFQELVLQAFGHASHDANQKAWLCGTQLVKDLDASPNALLGVVTDTAGVGHYQVGLLHHFRAFIAGIGKDGEDDLGVVHVHLTPVGFNISSFFPISATSQGSCRECRVACRNDR